MAVRLKWKLKGRTLALIKPDAQESTADIVDDIANAGFHIITKKRMARWSPEMAALFYEQHRDQPFFPVLVEHMSSGPITALVLQRKPATARKTVLAWRELMGPTDPNDPKAAVGTIRKKYAKPGDPIYKNIVHGSDSPTAAKREIRLVFSAFELLGK